MTDKYYFRVRRYLRNRGEADLDKYQVQYENDVYTITKWDYSDHPQPSLEILQQLSSADVNDEIEKIVKPAHTSDIYAFASQQNNRIEISAHRQNFCSVLSENQILLNKNGLYRITLSGEQWVRGMGTTEFKLLFTNNEGTTTMIYTTAFMGVSSIDYVCLLSITEPSKLHPQVHVRPNLTSYQLSGHVLVEFM